MAEPSTKKIYLIKLSVLLLAALACFSCPGLKEFVISSASYLQNHDFENLREFILSYGLWAPLTSIAIMTLQSLVPLVPGLIITMTNAWIFGWQYGAFYSWVGAFLGAMIDFGIARWYGRPIAEKLVNPKYLSITDSFFIKHGIMTVFITRLTPIIPFKVISYGAGLTALAISQFAFATGIGQIPAIILYSFFGQTLTKSLHMIVAVTLLLVGIGLGAFYCRNLIERRFIK
ncbi:TVP38/TMEM64 family inner membrane protein YdjZ [bioreactor metagenome]|uniref:TVP38/TMEM64 family inner membrane protein YdjZ n=1 Tax=bioreactor metagenome TaxID=1076179 RepID=A0A644T128_9ZZZZ|nr:TVP38/TMEM64 family protein [Negativicutes bacterium]